MIDTALGGRRQAFDHEAIIDRLAAPYMRRGTPIVMELVERLRAETTAHYCRAMKQTQLAYRLLDPLENLRVYPLHLAPTPERPPAPKKAKVSASLSHHHRLVPLCLSGVGLNLFCFFEGRILVMTGAQIALFDPLDPLAPPPETHYGEFTLPGFHQHIDWLKANCYTLQPKLARALMSIFQCTDRIYGGACAPGGNRGL